MQAELTDQQWKIIEKDLSTMAELFRKIAILVNTSSVKYKNPGAVSTKFSSLGGIAMEARNRLMTGVSDEKKERGLVRDLEGAEKKDAETIEKDIKKYLGELKEETKILKNIYDMNAALPTQAHVQTEYTNALAKLAANIPVVAGLAIGAQIPAATFNYTTEITNLKAFKFDDIENGVKYMQKLERQENTIVSDIAKSVEELIKFEKSGAYRITKFVKTNKIPTNNIMSTLQAAQKSVDELRKSQEKLILAVQGFKTRCDQEWKVTLAINAELKQFLDHLKKIMGYNNQMVQAHTQAALTKDINDAIGMGNDLIKNDHVFYVYLNELTATIGSIAGEIGNPAAPTAGTVTNSLIDLGKQINQYYTLKFNKNSGITIP